MKLHEHVIGVEDLRRLQPTITIRVSRPLRLRVWLAVRLLRVAAWLAGHTTDVRIDD